MSKRPNAGCCLVSTGQGLNEWSSTHLHRNEGAAPRTRVRPSLSLSVMTGLAAGLNLKSFEYLLQPVTMHPYVFSPSVLTSAGHRLGLRRTCWHGRRSARARAAGWRSRGA